MLCNDGPETVHEMLMQSTQAGKRTGMQTGMLTIKLDAHSLIASLQKHV
jgi:hypothetical protein